MKYNKCLFVSILAPLTLLKNLQKNEHKNENEKKKQHQRCRFRFTRRLCAPIASLDCMEEFSGNTGLDLSMGKFDETWKGLDLLICGFDVRQGDPSAWARRHRSRMCRQRQVNLTLF